MNLEIRKKYYLLLFIELVLVFYVGLKRMLFWAIRRKPAYNSWLYDRLPACRRIRETAEIGQTALSLDVVYNYAFSKKTGFDAWMERQWMLMPAAQAVRNRKSIVTRLLENEVRRAWAQDNDRPVNIVFFAGGFVETGITVAKRVNEDGIRVNCIVLDISRKALNQAKQNAEREGVVHNFSFMRINLLDFAKVSDYLSSLDVQVIEMIGILDYLSQAEAIKLFQVAKACLTSQGLLLTGNVLPMFVEAPFLYTVINWPLMHHRTVRQFASLLHKSGFIVDSEEAHPYIEPHKVFMVFEVRNPEVVELERFSQREPIANRA